LNAQLQPMMAEENKNANSYDLDELKDVGENN
jgi:hypothetical protein